MGEISLHKKLVEIQTILKASKGERNDFGKFNYRTLEGILSAVKPILASFDCSIVLSDELVLIGERYYVKATAILQDGQESMTAIAYAREASSQKGMAEGQLSGSTSSYARKYAVSGLFAIDNNKELDAQDNTMIGAPEKVKQIKAGTVADILNLATDINMLSVAWAGMSQEDRLSHEELKNDIKSKLQAVKS